MIICEGEENDNRIRLGPYEVLTSLCYSLVTPFNMGAIMANIMTIMIMGIILVNTPE